MSGTQAGKGITVKIRDSETATLEGQPYKIESGSAAKLRLLVDHSIVEAYAQGGRAVATRTYCKPSADSVGLQIFNNGPDPIKATITVHQLDTANVIPSQLPTVVV